MGLSAILFCISIGAFVLAKFAGAKSDSILVSENVKIDEQRIIELGLYVGQSVSLSTGTKDEIIIYVTNREGAKVQIHSYINASTYDVLSRKPIRAEIYSINGDVVIVEIKFKEAL